MPDIVIRPSMKFIKAGYIAVAILAVAAFIARQLWYADSPAWAPALVALLFLWPAKRHVTRMYSKLTISGDRLHYETGMLSRATRTIQLSKVQDVRVDQTLGQRLMGVGKISIETAGETSRLIVENLDHPQQVADELINRSQHHAAGAPGV